MPTKLLEFVFALPPKELSPNGRVCWQAKARAVRHARQAADIVARIGIGRRVRPQWKLAWVQATFYFRRRGIRDGDNLNAMLKPYLDGLADAGVVGNDNAFVLWPSLVELDADHPRMVLAVLPAAGDTIRHLRGPGR